MSESRVTSHESQVTSHDPRVTPPKHVIVGTAGHIDHGKSSLVLALTGTDPDRLAEEKRRGITIDLGFAFLDLGETRLGFVDVPGHERFVKNMLAGVGGIDLVLLVIAADESIKPQTREHFDICRLLGIPRGVTVITKSDAVDSETLGLVRLEVEEFLRGSFLDAAPIVPVSARTGDGLDQLRAELQRIAASVPAKDAGRYFRLPIDRAFAMKGFGTVVTGTLVSGAVAVEDEVELFPTRQRVRVRGVQSGGQQVERAQAGQRTALNLAGVNLDHVRRGRVLAAPGRFAPTAQIDARINLLPSARALKSRARVHFHQGTAECIAEVYLLESAQLRAGDSHLTQLRLSEPLLVLPGDRFILRQFSPVITIGGGMVLDALAPRHKLAREGPRVLRFLAALETGSAPEILAALCEFEPRAWDLPALIARTGRLESEVRAAAAELATAGTLRILTEQPFVIASAQLLADTLRRIGEQLDAFHKSNPLVEGLPKEDLRERVAPGLGPDLFRAALDDAARSGAVTVTGDLVKRAGRAIALSPEESRARDQIEQAFAHAGLAVPPVKEVLGKLAIESQRAQKILQLLLREGVLVKVGEELLFHRAAIAALREQLAGYKKKLGDRLPIAAFKELTGISRKYAIPLLEYLDRERVTRRAGDERIIL
ncbi:MAG: selenocysteine-specific translation elongation factor [Candidatus Acidiferrales bacterium]